MTPMVKVWNDIDGVAMTTNNRNQQLHSALAAESYPAENRSLLDDL